MVTNLTISADPITVQITDVDGIDPAVGRFDVSFPAVLDLGGGDGTGDVTGPASSVDGRPAVFTGTTGKVIRQGNVNSPGGLLVLDEDGTVPDIRIPASIARDTEVAAAVSEAVVGLVEDGDPRLTDDRDPTPHTHPASDITDLPTGGGVWEIVSEQILTSDTAAVTIDSLADWAEIEIRWAGRCTAAADQATYMLATCNGDTGSNYNRSVLYRQASTVALNESGQSAGWLARISGAQVNLNRWAHGVIRLRGDQPAGTRRYISGEFVAGASTVESHAVGQCSTEWTNTADALTSLTLAPASGSFLVGCKFTVIGRS